MINILKAKDKECYSENTYNVSIIYRIKYVENQPPTLTNEKILLYSKYNDDYTDDETFWKEQ